MEFYSKKLNIFVAISIAVATGLSILSCTNNEPFDQEHGRLEKLIDGNERMILPTGDTILLTDTVTYNLDLKTITAENITDKNKISISRAFELKGYDMENKPADYKKFRISGLEKYGLIPTNVYIGKTITYYKFIPVRSNYSILPSNNKYANENTMGFNPPSLTSIGFHTITNDSFLPPGALQYSEAGVTQILYVNCDVSGKMFDKNVPCEPNDLIWYYREIPDEE